MNTKIWTRVCGVALAMGVLSMMAQAQNVPNLINCQGRLFDGQKPLNGDVNMILRLYDQPTGGNMLYEDKNSVRLSDGFYSTYLGDNSSQGSLEQALASGTVWLEVTANNTVYEPRERLASSPFAVMAGGVRPGGITASMLAPGAIGPGTLGKGSVGAEQLLDGAITSASILDGAILEEDIADGSVTPPKLSQSYWTTAGNISEAGKLIFMGTVDERPLDLRVNNKRALRLSPHVVTPGVIGGHEQNVIKEGVPGAVIAGGGQPNQSNRVEAEFGVVSGGAGNTASGPFAVIGGGLDNSASGNRSVISGGRGNVASGVTSTISGGYSNRVTQSYATVSGGYGNQANGYVATVGGGWGNQATGVVAVVSGGQDNQALGDASVVAGGWANSTLGYASAVSGGRGNRAEGDFSVIGGGTNNFVSGTFAMIPGGIDNIASGESSFAAGRGARAGHPGAFVWSDGQEQPFASTAARQFLIRAKGNVGIDTDSPSEKLTVSGNVLADAFIGDGSRLTGLQASTLADGAVNDRAIAADAQILPQKIAGTALTRQDVLGGVLEGTFTDARIKAGSIGAEQLVPNLLTLAIEDSKVAGRVATLESNTLKTDSAAGGQLSGTLSDLQIAKGVIDEAQLKPGLIEAVLARSEMAKKVGSLDELAKAKDLLAQQLTELQGFISQKTGTIGGDLQGALSELKIRDGVIGEAQLQPGLLARAVEDSQLAKTVGALADIALTKDTKFHGQILGTADKLVIKPGSIGPDELIPGFIENAMAVSPLAAEITRLQARMLTNTNQFSGDVQGPMDKVLLKNGVVQRKHLAPGTLEGLVDDKTLAELFAEFEKGLMPLGVVFDGDVRGPAQQLKLKDGIIEARHLAANLLDDVIARSDLSKSVGTLADQTLKKDFAFGGDVSGTAGALKLKPGVVSAAQIAPGSITADKLAKGVLPTFSLENAVVTGDKLAANAVTEEKLAANAVTEEKLAANAVTGDKLAVNTVSTEKLATNAVTAEKMAANAVTAEKIAANAVTAEKIPAGSITADKLAKGVLPTFSLDKAVITGNQLAKGSVTADKIAPGSITADKLAFKLDQGVNLNGADGSLVLNAGSAPALRLLPHRESPNIVLGSEANRIGEEHYGSSISGGGSKADPHRISGAYNVIGGGLGNQTALEYATVAGGYLNEAKGSAATIAGGWKNRALELDATVGGGQENLAGGSASTVSGGMSNRATGKYSVVPGGLDNAAEGEFSLAAGRRARALHPGAFVWADGTDADFSSTAANQFLIRASGNVGIDVNAPAEKLTVGGNVAPGSNNTFSLGAPGLRWKTLYLGNQLSIADSLSITSGEQVRFKLNADGGVSFAGFQTRPTGESPVIIGGSSANRVEPKAFGSTIAGGGNADHPNTISAEYGTIGGGFGNQITGFDGTISGGQDNVAGGSAAVIGGGFMNTTDGLFPAIAGGAANQALGNLAAIAGGFSNRVSGAYASIPGGYQNEASGDFSLAAGRRARAAHSGSFVWADASNAAFTSTERNQFLARASGGIWFYSNSDLTSGVKLNPGSGSWSMLSSRDAKENFVEVNTREVVEKLLAMPIYSWNYKTQEDEVRHVGPTAQDFLASFAWGEDDAHISSVDADGVALAAIKGLAELVKEKEGQIEKLNAANNALETRLQRLEKLLAPLESR